MSFLTGQVALITGAGSGIGQALARGLAAQGATLVLVGRRRDALESVQADLIARGSVVRVHPADLTRDQDIRDLVASVQREPARVDILVHNAGVFRRGPWTDTSPEDLDDQYRTSCRAPFLLTKLLLPTMREYRGQVVFINSSAGQTARAEVGAYSAARDALRALADSLREEVNRDGIRVLSVFCGRTATPMQEEVHALEGRPYRPERLLQPEDVAQVVVNALGLPRTAEVTDIHLRPMQGPG